MDICPVGAIDKDANGVCTIDTDKCIGCRYCEWACPYGAPQFDHVRNVMTKCTFCKDLVDMGENPACVDACPMRALDFGEIGELRAKYGDAGSIEPFPSPSITKPAIVIGAHKNSELTGKGQGTIANLAEEV